MSVQTWTGAAPRGTRVLLVVNSTPALADEIERVVARLEQTAGLDHVYAIAPAVLRPALIRRGLVARHIRPAQLHGLDVELSYFLDSAEAVQWAVSCGASLVVGTEPYAPANAEVKPLFEERVAPMVGGGRFVVHSLPDATVYLLTADQLWERAARREIVAAYESALASELTSLYAEWNAAGRPGVAANHRSLAEPVNEALGRIQQVPSACRSPAVDAARSACERLHRAVELAGVQARTTPRLLVDGEGLRAVDVIPERVEPVRRPAQRVAGIAVHGTRLAFRGEAEGPYSYLLMSRPRRLRRGDTAVAEGRVYRGGVTLGLVKDGRWASKVDVDEPAEFIAVAVAREPGEHALVVANCLKNAQRRNAIAIRRFGWGRRGR